MTPGRTSSFIAPLRFFEGSLIEDTPFGRAGDCAFKRSYSRRKEGSWCLSQRVFCMCAERKSVSGSSEFFAELMRSVCRCRLRQLILTRLIQCLYQPQYKQPLGGPATAGEKMSNDDERVLAGLIAESLVLSGESLNTPFCTCAGGKTSMLSDIVYL